jgi:catechol 2,3-dioxygenase-like lactoylglutathione lyase family enzyme
VTVAKKRFHVALAVRDFDEAIHDYTARLGAEPCCTVENTYALWRTPEVNLSISVNPERAGSLRHVGFEDSSAPAMTMDNDRNGVEWEHFSEAQQDEEIRSRWPNARFRS